MTVIEKKDKLKQLIDSFSENELEQVFDLVERFAIKDKKRIEIVQEFLVKEKSLFDRLAQ